MRTDHVFYGYVGGRYPTAEVVDYHVHAAHRLRAEAVHGLLRVAFRRLVDLFRRRPQTKLQSC